MLEVGGPPFRRWLVALTLAILALGLSKPWAWTGVSCPAELRGAAPPTSLLAAAPAECRLDAGSSPWAHHCQRLQNVCLDSSTLIFYDEEYQEHDGKAAGPLPKLAPAKRGMVYRYPWRTPDNGGVNATGSSVAQQPRRKTYQAEPPDTTRRLEPPRVRPASAREPTPYLQHPSFSSCTVPVLLGVTWDANLWHVFDNAAVWRSLVQRTPWRQHLKPLVMTPEGLALSSIVAQLLPALAPLAVQSLADASTRLPPSGQLGGGTASAGMQPPAAGAVSFEGGELRCFANLFYCGQHLEVNNTSLDEQSKSYAARAGAAAAAGETQAEAEAVAAAGGGDPTALPHRELYGFGQAVVRRELLLQQVKTAEEAVGPAKPLLGEPEAQPLAGGGGGGGGGGGSGEEVAGQLGTSGAGARQLSIVFLQRDSLGRQLLNMEQLLASCNEWQYEARDGNRTVEWRATCSKARTPSISAGVAVAQAADVLVGMHGANMANAFFMRPGSSTVEIMPYQYEQHPGSSSQSVFNAHDPTSLLLWWVAVVCDPASSQPGPLEAAGTGDSTWWPRDRQSQVPWEAIAAVLREVAALQTTSGGGGGSADRLRHAYLEQYYRRSRHRHLMNATGVVGYGDRCLDS